MKKIMVLALALVLLAGAVYADDVEVTITCNNPEIPAAGGQLCFNVVVDNNLGYGHAAQIWLMVDGPNCTSGPYLITCFWLYPMGNIFPGCGIQIPDTAGEGDYVLHVYVGGYAQNYIAATADAYFCKLPAE